VDLKIFCAEHSTTKIEQTTRLRCRLCGKRYEILPVGDYSWVQQRLYLSDSALVSLKSIYGVGEVDLDDLLGSATALTKVSKDRFHIVIKKFNIKSYIDCHYDRKKDQLTGGSVQRLTS
jgi:hypothetical protein